MHQERLFRLAVEAGTVNFWHEPGAGWTVVLAIRRGDEPWSDAKRETYTRLTTVELLDTVASHLDAVL